MSKGLLDFLDVFGGGAGIAALLGMILLLLDRRTSQRKAKADYADQISNAAIALLEPMQKQVDQFDKQLKGQARQIGRLRKLLETYAKRVVYLMGGINQLITQIVAFRETPCWQPDDTWQAESYPNDLVDQDTEGLD